MKTLAFLVLVVVFAVVGFSEAADKPVAGLYAIQGQDVCLGRWTYNPFSQNPYSPSSVWTKTSNVQGTVNFLGDGTGKAEETIFTVLHPIYTPIPAAPYYGFQYNVSPLGNPGGWPRTSGVYPFSEGSTNPQLIDNMWWPAPLSSSTFGWPAEPPWTWPTVSGFGGSIGNIGTLNILKGTTTVVRTVSPSGGGVTDSSTSGVAQFIYSQAEGLIGKYVKTTPGRKFTGYVSADQRTILISTTVPTEPGSTPWDEGKEIWSTVEFYDNYDPATGEFLGFFGSQQEICQRQRTLIQIK